MKTEIIIEGTVLYTQESQRGRYHFDRDPRLNDLLENVLQNWRECNRVRVRLIVEDEE